MKATCTDCPRSSAPPPRESTTPSGSECNARRRMLRGLDWFEVTGFAGTSRTVRSSTSRVTLKIGFRMEDPASR